MKTFLRKGVLTVLGIILANLIAGNAPAQGSFGVTYDFNQVTASSGTTDPTPPPSSSGATFGSFTAVGYTGSPNAGGRFSWQANPLGGVNGSDDFTQFSGSLNPAVYFEVALSPLAAFALQLDSFSFTILRSSTGIRNYAVRSSLDGYAANLPASINPANANLGVGPANEFRWLSDAVSTAQIGSAVTLGSAYADLTSPVKFRFYGWNAEGSLGTFSIDNVAFAGSTRNVPEPSAAALLALGLAACGVRRVRACRTQNHRSKS
jgi:hypothetical protein